MAGATKLLEEAGYTKGADGIYAKGGKKLSLRFSTTAGNKLRETQGELFQAQMKEIGVEIKIANVDSPKFFGEWLPNGNFDIANFAWVGTPFAISGSRDIYRTGGGSNYGKYANKKVDDLFTQANGETDEAKSAELGNQIDQQLTADMVTIPLYTQADVHRLAQHLRQHQGQRHQRRALLRRQHLGAEDRLEPWGSGEMLWTRAGGRPPARVVVIVTSVTSPGEGAPCSASSSAGC